MPKDREKEEIRQRLKSLFAHPEYVESVWGHIDVCDECCQEINDLGIRDDFQKYERVVNGCRQRISDSEADQTIRSKNFFSLFVNFIRDVWTEK